MEQYILKSTLVAEIERLRKNNEPKENMQYAQFELDIAEGYDIALDDIEAFINTLEGKEVDLEEKATQLSQKYFPDEENIWARPNIEAQKCKSACIEMVEWLKAQKGE